jgi:SAM-dependent methyltransferase
MSSPESTPSQWSYDAIADVYATDMGQSMPFDDVACYRALTQANGGRTLELGCGTGRILLELLAAGIDAFGADRSLPMLKRLRRDAASRRLTPRAAQMDLRALALRGTFDTILLPYSLITYITDRDVAATVLTQLRERLARDGVLVLDAFVPQPVASFADFRLDYRRPHGAGTLERHKRITAMSDGTNRIERRYRLYADNATTPTDEFHTDETIRPYGQADLSALAAAAGLQVDKWIFDYGTRAQPEGARFATVLLRA